MTDASIAQRKPDDGVDAPGVIRNLGLAAGIGLGVWGSVLAHLWSGLVPLGRDAFLDVRGMGLGIGATSAAMAIWMLWSSKTGKISGREALLDRVIWTGSERDERGQAIAEICRVLAPGGHALIDDIRHIDEYSEAFRKGGITKLERVDSTLVSNLLAVITFGSLRPGIIHARKS
jgi:hypothetical protein